MNDPSINDPPSPPGRPARRRPTLLRRGAASVRCRGTLLLSLVSLGCSGCASDLPRSRLGALPFPGLFTLYTAADPQRLGPHRYGPWPRLLRADETERGIIYTTRAGFVDVAHVRIAIDWARYYAARVRRAVEEGRSEVELPGMNRSRLHVRFHYPREWAALGPQERRLPTRELSFRAGQQLAYLTVTWHELITWFGHRSLFFVDESPSAFTYDDGMSHVLGLRVADRALRDPTRGWDVAVTAALEAELRELGAVSPARTDRAVRAVEDVWWDCGKPLKRQFNVGLRDGVVHPWLVPGLPFAPDAEPRPFPLPSLDGVRGRDLSGFYSVEIEPRIPAARCMRQHLPGAPRRFCRDRDIPVLLRVLRGQMREQFGPDVNVPLPASTGKGGCRQRQAPHPQRVSGLRPAMPSRARSHAPAQQSAMRR